MIAMRKEIGLSFTYHIAEVSKMMPNAKMLTFHAHFFCEITSELHAVYERAKTITS